MRCQLGMYVVLITFLELRGRRVRRQVEGDWRGMGIERGEEGDGLDMENQSWLGLR